MNYVKGKVIIITGASSGIGFEVMKRLAADKSNTILAVARRVQKLEGLADNIIPFSADVSGKEGIDAVFEKATEVFGTIDIFYANAGTPYYELYDYEDWDRLKAIFDLNTLSPIYSYAKYIHHLDGKPGHMVYTISAIGEMAMPGFALYAASKFGLNGFQQGIRLEMPKNLKITSIYPVSTKTNFAKVAGEGEVVDMPSPVQAVEEVADAVVDGISKGKESVYPCKVYLPSKFVFTISKAARASYWKKEGKKFEKFLKIKAKNKA